MCPYKKCRRCMESTICFQGCNNVTSRLQMLREAPKERI